MYTSAQLTISLSLLHVPEPRSQTSPCLLQSCFLSKNTWDCNFLTPSPYYYSYPIKFTFSLCIHMHTHTHTHTQSTPLEEYVCRNIPLQYIRALRQHSHSVLSDSFATTWTAACQASLSITKSQSLLKLMSIELVMPSNHLILYCPLRLLPLIFPSIRVFSNESVLCTRWPKYWSFSFSISPSNEYSGLGSIRMD